MSIKKGEPGYEEYKARQREYYANNARYRERMKELSKLRYAANKESLSQQMSKRKRSIRIEAIEGYGATCARCGDTDIRHLILHHRNGGGSQHRRELGGGTALYRWAIENGFPDDLECVCANCHAEIHWALRDK